MGCGRGFTFILVNMFGLFLILVSIRECIRFSFFFCRHRRCPGQFLRDPINSLRPKSGAPTRPKHDKCAEKSNRAGIRTRNLRITSRRSYRWTIHAGFRKYFLNVIVFRERDREGKIEYFFFFPKSERNTRAQIIFIWIYL